LRKNFFGPISATNPVEGSKDAASFLVCTLKKFLLGGSGFFVSDSISGRLLGHIGPLNLALRPNR